MRSTRRNTLTNVGISLFTSVSLILLTCSVPPSQVLAAPQNTPVVNPPPCDFNDSFYTANGISVSQLNSAAGQRFGLFRQTGPPASSFNGGTVNWKNDNTCRVNNPITDQSQDSSPRSDVRILATTGGYVDDGTGSPTDFISIIAFLTNQTFFTGVANKRNIQMVDIVSNFEAYAALKQRMPDGTFARNPCGSMASPLAPTTPCFPVTSVATPNLRQDWRFATNRNAIDGSDGNRVNGTGSNATIVNNSPFGYFCDDLLGMWIITYFWFVVDPANPGSTCGPILSALAQKNGVSLDGTPIIKTADELNNQLEANGCGAEGQEDVNGGDGGAVWLICPAIPDPRQGGIAPDAFPDVVFKPDGTPVDPAIINNFHCLQSTGQFCS